MTQRSDSAFWHDRAAMNVPDSLTARIENFAENAQAWQESLDLFRTESWLYVMLGQGLMPQGWHRLANLLDDKRLAQALQQQREAVAAQVAQMPAHGDFVRSYASDRGS